MPRWLLTRPASFKASLAALRARAGTAARRAWRALRHRRTPVEVLVADPVRRRALERELRTGLARLERGDMPGVYADADAKARLAEGLRQPAQEAYVVGMQATLALFEGRFADAEALIPRAFALGQRAHGWMTSVYNTLQWYALRREQAILRIRGANRRHLLRMHALRTLALAAVGSVLGVALGLVSSAAVLSA